MCVLVGVFFGEEAMALVSFMYMSLCLTLGWIGLMSVYPFLWGGIALLVDEEVNKHSRMWGLWQPFCILLACMA
jgi:hypothetical protein